MRKSLIVLAAFMLVLTACAPGQNPADVQAQVETAVAQTMSAQDQIATSVAQTVAAQNPTSTSTAIPTATSGSLPTLTPVIPTVTPLNTPSSGSGSGSGSGNNSTANYACDVISRRPRDNTEYNREADFDIKWTIVNTGTKTWPAGYDLKYSTGPHLVTPTRIELPEMKPKAQFDIVFDAKAPTQKGSHIMIWVVEGRLCFPYTAIIVK
jgi:hypothetical protein